MKATFGIALWREIQRRPILLAVPMMLIVGLLSQRSLLGTHRTALTATPASPRIEYVSRSSAPLIEYVPRTSAHACTDKDKVPPKEELEFLSQQKEDTVLMNWFAGLCGGTYMEMGALDGLTYSNTFVFHQHGWKGVLIDPSPKNYEKLIKNRPDEIATVHAAVCKESRTVHWVDRHAISGIYELASESYKKQWWTDEHIKNMKPVECKRLADLLSKHAPQHTFFDFFSLDVEGGEYEVLLSIDFDRVHFGIVFAESDRHNQRKNLAVRSLLEMNGYHFLENKQGSMWFMNQQFALIYKDLVYATLANE